MLVRSRTRRCGFQMVGPMQRLLLTLSALVLMFSSSIALGQEVLNIREGFAMSVTVPGAQTGTLKAIVGKPEIADVTFGPKNVFWFIGKKTGETNIIVVNSLTGASVYNATIQVSPPSPPKPADRSKIISQLILPRNVQDRLTVREYYCDPGCVYLATQSQENNAGNMTTTSRFLNAEGGEIGRRVDTTAGQQSPAPPPSAEPPPQFP
jgi:Pilus formation protein N terminal region